jgi:hypothetical protein
MQRHHPTSWRFPTWRRLPPAGLITGLVVLAILAFAILPALLGLVLKLIVSLLPAGIACVRQQRHAAVILVANGLLVWLAPNVLVLALVWLMLLYWAIAGA